MKSKTLIPAGVNAAGYRLYTTTQPLRDKFGRVRIPAGQTVTEVVVSKVLAS